MIEEVERNGISGKVGEKPSLNSGLLFPSWEEDSQKQNEAKVEFGDFQTPLAFAVEVCLALKRHGINPTTVIEPTCGLGSFLVASCQVFPELKRGFGFDINPGYVKQAAAAIAEKYPNKSEKPVIRIEKRDVFEVGWEAFVESLPQPALFVGNLPWVTNSVLGQLGSANCPVKENSSGLRGLDALTGKSNFDISEWMLRRMLDSIQNTNNKVAMLCKTSVARKILKYAHENNLLFGDAHLCPIDAKAIFGASVDACLFRFGADVGMSDFSCAVYGSLASKIPTHRFGFVDHSFVANVDAYQKTRKVEGVCSVRWRSGIKHDSAMVMELRVDGEALKNGDGETVQIEDEFLYPLLKSSDLSKVPVPIDKKMLVVTQQRVGEETVQLKTQAPRLWQYLTRHEAVFARRKSSIYNGKPPFSIFGVGPYSFALWKVAISGLYKQSKFTLLGPHEGKPIMFDDTCYFLPFDDEEEARRCHTFLNSKSVQEFLESVVFWDAKRPINAELLQRISMAESDRKG